MRNYRNSYVFQRMRAKFSSFLIHEITPPPILYFLIFAYSHYPLEQAPASFGVLLFSVAIKIMLVSNFNFLFIMAPFLASSPIMAIPILAITLFACNEKWKMYIFIFAIGDNAFAGDDSHHYFLALFSGLICFQTFRTLIFRTITDNIYFFIGMAGISAYYSLKILISNLNIKENTSVMVILVLSAVTFAHSLIYFRIKSLKASNIATHFLDRQMAHFLKMMENDINDHLKMQWNIRFHYKICQNALCYCKNKQFRDKPEYLIRNLYKQAIQKFKQSNDGLLFEHYIDFLIKNKQIINALHFLSNWDTTDYFSYIAKARSRAKIQSFLEKQNTSNLYEKQYSYALQYDQHSLYVAIQINKILKLKLQFWNEINKETPRVVRIQKLGYQIINTMHQLNVFYNSTIKVCQQKIFVFDSTVLYGMYMLSTTNFKEYAQIIIKNTAKLLEQVYIFENNASQTFAIRTIVKNQLKNHSDHSNESLGEQECEKFIRYEKGHYKLIIDAVSSGLCKLLHLTKGQLIDNQLQIIIPDGYKKVHNARMSHLLDFDTQQSKKIAPSKIIHKELKLPIKGANGQLIMGFVNIKFIVDPQNGLSFLSIVRLIHDRSSNILMNFSGQITEMEEGFNEDIIQHSQVKKYLSKLRNSWIKHKVINEQKFNVMMNSANYIISLNSPYLSLFQSVDMPQNPPIHIEVVNEETIRNRTVQSDKNNKIGRQIKHMQNALHNYDASQSSSSSKGGALAVNILTVFSENNTVPLYRFLYITFVGIITCCIISNIGTYFVTQLPWDTTVATNNPINDTMNFNAIKMLTIKGMITLNDEVTYFTEPNLNTTRIAQYFGFSNYTSSVIGFTENIEQAYKDCLYNLLGTSSDFLSQQINKILMQYITITNPNGSLTVSQDIHYQGLAMIYITDFDLMTQMSLNNTILAATYSPTIVDAQNASYLSQVIDRGVNQSQTISIAVHISLMVFSAFLLIPLVCLLRKRLSLHEKIFDLLVSIDAVEVQHQIKSLEYISNILRNYKESNDIMKMNVLDYEENMIHPRAKGSRSSVDNDMILGLEKYDIHNPTNQVEYVASPQGQQIISSRNSNQSFKVTSIIKRGQNSRNTSNIGTLIKTKLVSTKQQHSKVNRKRAGELDLEGSDLDPNKKIIPYHCIVYTISVSFLIFLVISIILNINYNNRYISLKNNLLSIYNQQILFEQYLLTIKVYLIDGGSAINSIFNVTNELQIILPDINAVPTYNYYDDDILYSQTIMNCTNTSVIPNTFKQKYCQLNYSEVVLRGQFGAIFKELTQLRYAYDHGLLINQMPNQTLINIKQKFYYLESINIRLQQLVITKINLIFQRIVDVSNIYNDNKQLLLALSVIWGFSCFLIGLAIEIRMKEGYFKEIFMITLLNNQMIITNKRVESFLESIAKNTYS